jgi:hypothetical protein
MLAKSIRSKFLLWLAFLLICLLVGFGVTAFELFRTNQNHQIYAQLQRRLSAVASDLSLSPRERPVGRFGSPDRNNPSSNLTNPPQTDSVSCETNQVIEHATILTTNDLARTEPGRRRFPHHHSDDFSPPGEPDRKMREHREPSFETNGWAGFGARNEPPNTKLSAEALDLFDQSNPNSFYFIVWNRAGVERLRSSNAPAQLEIAPPVQRAGGPQVRVHGQYLESFLQHAMGYRVLVGRSIAPGIAARRHFAF